MFEKVSPESVGVPSRRIGEYFRSLRLNGFAMHDVLMMRHGKLFTEEYWAPFHKDFCHRQYSQTKSYMSVAIGLLEAEGKLSLSAPIVSYFPDKIEGEIPKELARQTVRDMLTMETGVHVPWWFGSDDPDRTHLYLNRAKGVRPSATLWEYDSAGSQVLSSLVERLSGMTLFDYLYDRVFQHLGTFQTAEILKTRNGDSWGDSALLCTPRDMISFANLLLHGGVHEGRQLIPADYLREATSPQVYNDEDGWPDPFERGYGYQIWCTEEEGFAFVGMGGQLTVVLPKYDFVFVCNADVQGNPFAYNAIVRAMFDHIVYALKEGELPQEEEGTALLREETKALTLLSEGGRRHVALEEQIQGKTFLCEENPTGITAFSFTFGEEGGVFRYENASGKKELPFGLCRNEFCQFPEYGYSDGAGGVRTTNGFTYRAAVSAGWREEGKLSLRVQIIDRYFGNLRAIFAFRGNEVAVSMRRSAEDFLHKYEGTFRGKMMQ